MKYSLGTNLADFGFVFLEKIHQPIFLVHKLGKISKINEAGRKLIRISHVSANDLENFVKTNVLALFKSSDDNYKRLKIKKNGLHVIARSLRDSDFILVEVRR
ncbi:MAG: hypothetical protein KF799_10690 [Bdellovibrionales bacterium]|nr:hypothetical protein [Bdellovibrionales bacterium]